MHLNVVPKRAAPKCFERRSPPLALARSTDELQLPGFLLAVHPGNQSRFRALDTEAWFSGSIQLMGREE